IRDDLVTGVQTCALPISFSGLSAPAITRLTSSWSAEREAFMARDLSGVDYVYCWVDGVHFTVRLGDDDRLCVLVIVGVRTDGTRSEEHTSELQSPDQLVC